MTENLEKRVMDKIEAGQVTMRPKAYFVTRAILFWLGTILTGLFSIYILSFILFRLTIRGAWLMPAFTLMGMRDLLLSLPFIIMLLMVLFIAIFWWFTKHFPFAYRRPVAYSLIGIVLIVLLGGFLVAKTPLHIVIFKKFGHEKQSPGIMHSLYMNPGREPIRNAVIGEIVNMENGEINVITVFRKYCTVIISDNTINFSDTKLTLGDWIFTHGEIKRDRIFANVIKEVNAGDYMLEKFEVYNSNFAQLPKGCHPG